MSKWINHVKKYAVDHGITYGKALSNPKCKKDYRIKNKKGGEQEQEQEQLQHNQEQLQNNQEQLEEMKGGEQQGGRRRRFTNKYFKKRFAKGFNKSVRKLRSSMRKPMRKMKSASKKNWFW